MNDNHNDEVIMINFNWVLVRVSLCLLTHFGVIKVMKTNLFYRSISLRCSYHNLQAKPFTKNLN